ncbi:NADH dehydrogenase subunit 5 [Trypanosoma theileri]|uniref:NADH dehydrogenase subunit 5 (Mitochondrion) n=1 Tax=Trypanosoma theileri TaxID=67003 RepID=A0A1X0NEY5_9TRYP|nr:NADH dehydrogenase subunit 5 [Trypanosoma theileri]ORC82520.1 NADH dehydrogenase subunit 5 [Trypanosoma theileri]
MCISKIIINIRYFKFMFSMVFVWFLLQRFVIMYINATSFYNVIEFIFICIIFILFTVIYNYFLLFFLFFVFKCFCLVDCLFLLFNFECCLIYCTLSLYLCFVCIFFSY